MEHGWVAIVDQVVIGFLMGSISTTAQQRRVLTKILPSVVGNAVRERYRFGRHTWQSANALVKATLDQEFVHYNLKQYPAHQHINVAKKGKGYGIGRQLGLLAWSICANWVSLGYNWTPPA